MKRKQNKKFDINFQNTRAHHKFKLIKTQFLFIEFRLYQMNALIRSNPLLK